MRSLSIVKESLFLPSSSFDFESTLFSGQSFRWSKGSESERYFTGVIGNTVLLLKEVEPGMIKVSSTSETIDGLSLNDFFYRFFSLDIDENKVFSESFKRNFPDVWRHAKTFKGVRVMRQAPFEIMVTFMCAQGIGMHLIRRQISMIAERYGEMLALDSEKGKKIFHIFPAPSALASANRDELALCTNNNRIRAANIITLARAFESGALAFACVGSGECPLDTLYEALCAHKGIGMKIADCIALFGLGRFDAFPIDTHVKQYLWEWFGIEAARHSLTEKNYRFLQEKAKKILGNDLAGYAGHILFHCWRKEVKKMKAY
jgi:N-glycosylase/DNA lyase